MDVTCEAVACVYMNVMACMTTRAKLDNRESKGFGGLRHLLLGIKGRLFVLGAFNAFSNSLLILYVEMLPHLDP